MNTQNNDSLAQRLDGAGWALVLIWIGIALWAHFTWALGFIGVGAIVLGGALARSVAGVPVEGFRVAAGITLLAIGLWEEFRLSWPLVPIVIIACGLAVLWQALRPRSGGRSAREDARSKEERH
jgi:small neutral amino acid transporter SnatA (MarC family)